MNKTNGVDMNQVADIQYFRDLIENIQLAVYLLFDPSYYSKEVEQLGDVERFLALPKPFRYQTFATDMISTSNDFTEKYLQLSKKSEEFKKCFETLKHFIFAYIVLYCEMYRIYTIIEQIFEPFTTNKKYSVQIDKLMLEGRLNNTNNNTDDKPISKLIKSIISKIAKIRIIISNSLEACERTIFTFISQILTLDKEFRFAFESSNNNLIESLNRKMMQEGFKYLLEPTSKSSHTAIGKRVSIKGHKAPKEIILVESGLPMLEMPLRHQRRTAKSPAIAAAAAAVSAINRASVVNTQNSTISHGLRRKGALRRTNLPKKPLVERVPTLSKLHKMPTIYRTSILSNKTMHGGNTNSSRRKTKTNKNKIQNTK